MIATAVFLRRRRAACASRLLRYALFLLASLLPTPAAAQLAGSVAIDSDYRLRGYSLTDDQPALTAQASYDDPSGAYFSLSALEKLGDSTRFLGVIANVGYAKRISEHLTLDGGVLRSQIRSSVRYAPGYKYTDIYAGAFMGPIAARVHYSPDYRTGGLSTLYGELEGGFEPARNWRLSAHVGMLVYLSSDSFYREGETHRDWRIGISRQFGRVEIHSALSGGEPSRYYGLRVHKPVAATVGASFNF